MIGKLIDKSIKSILLDNNRLISLQNRTKSIITKYWGVCIDFINNFQSWYHSWTTEGHQEKCGEIKGKQEKARSRELSSNWKGKGLSALPVWLVHFSTVQLLVTCCYCKLCVRFRWFSVSSVFSVFSMLINAADQRHEFQQVLVLVLLRFGKRSPVKNIQRKKLSKAVMDY